MGIDNYGYNIAVLYGKIRQYTQPYINKYINYEPNISEVYENKIYISDFATSCDIDLLKEIGITHIIIAVIGIDPLFPSDFEYLKLDMPDVNNCNLISYIYKSKVFIDDAIKNNGKVLVHCMYGISRSVSIVCGYLMYTNNWTYDKAIITIKSKRINAKPNDGFIFQLNDISKLLNITKV